MADEPEAPGDAASAPDDGEQPRVELFVDPKHAWVLEDMPPVVGNQVMPEWFVSTDPHFRRHTQFQVFPPELKLRENSTVRACPGIVDFMAGGYVLRLWSDYAITFDEEVNVERGTVRPVWRWQSPQQELTLSNHDPGQHEKLPNPGFPVIIKFESPWFCRTPPGYSIRMLPMFYHFEQLWDVLPGVIHADTFHDTHLNVRFHIRKGTLVLPAGTPLCQLVPFKRTRYALEVGVGDEASMQAVRSIRRKRGRLFSDPHSYPRAKGTM